MWIESRIKALTLVVFLFLTSLALAWSTVEVQAQKVRGREKSRWAVLPAQAGSETSTSATISPAGGTLTSPSDQTTYLFLPDTFTSTVTITHTPQFPGTSLLTTDLVSIGHLFDVNAAFTDSGQPANPTRAYSLTIQYTAAEISPVVEHSLALYGWDGSSWLKEGSSQVDTAANTITASPEHFSLWAVLGERKRTYLPLIRKQVEGAVNPLILHFDEPPGATSFADASGYNHQASCAGPACPATVTGVSGAALRFDGLDDYLSLGNPEGLAIEGEISLGAWVQVEATDGFRTIVAHGYSLEPKGEVFLRVEEGSYRIGAWDGSGHETVYPVPPQDMGTWVYLVGTYDGTAWRLYRNGVEVSVTEDETGAVSAGANWAVGARGTGTERFFRGVIDEVVIYNYALSAEAVAASYAEYEAAHNRAGLHQLGGAITAVAVQGDYAYVGVGPRLGVVNVANPADPFFVGQSEVLSGTIPTIAVVGNYAYVADNKDSNLHIIDVSNPTSLVEVGFYHIQPQYQVDNPIFCPSASSEEVVVSGNYAYVVVDTHCAFGPTSSLHIFDISDPSNPTQVGDYRLKEDGLAIDAFKIDVVATILYLVRTNSLLVFDVTDPTTLVEISEYDGPFAYPTDIRVVDSYAYISAGGFHIVDVSDPTVPVVVGNYPRGGHTVEVIGDYAYISVGGLYIMDLTNRAAPIVVGFSQELAGGDLAVAANYVYAAADGLQIIDVSNPTGPVEFGIYGVAAPAEGVYAVGNTTYLLAGDLRILDTSNPATPIQIGSTSTCAPGINIMVSENYAYMTGADSFCVIDISDPSNPSQTSSYVFASPLADSISTPSLVAQGDYVYFIGQEAGCGIYGCSDPDTSLRIVDVSDPTAAVEIVRYTLPSENDLIWDMAVKGAFAYLVSTSGLHIIDLSNPNLPVEVSFYSTTEAASEITIAGDYAYVALDNGLLQIIDVQIPTSPVEVSSLEGPSDIRDMTIAERVVYMATSSGLYLIDVSNPSEPFQKLTYSLSPYLRRIQVTGGYAYLTEIGVSTGALRIMNVANLVPLVEVGTYKPIIGNSHDIAVADNSAYITSGNNLHIFDLSNPIAPVEVSTTTIPGGGWQVVVSGDNAYLYRWLGGLHIIDITDPEHPVEVSFYDSHAIVSLVVSGDYAYIAADDDGLRILNIADPANPTEVGFYETPEYAYGVTLVDNYVYLTTDFGGLHIIDVSNPMEPSEVGFYDVDTGWDIEAISVVGQYAYAVFGHGELSVIDVSSPAALIEIGAYELDGYANDLVIVDNLAYVTVDRRGLRIIDVSNPADPLQIAAYDLPDAESLDLVDDRIYVTASGAGLFIIKVTPSNGDPVSLSKE